MPRHDASTIKLAVVGMHDVGKSALTVRFMTRRFITEYADGFDSAYTHAMTVKGRSYEVVLIDQGVQLADNKDLLHWADGFILVYSIECRKSFEAVQELLKEIKTKAGRRRVGVTTLVGNKTDLSDKRQVSTAEAKKLAKENNSTLHEVSAAQEIEAVAAIFNSCIYKIIESLRLDLTRNDHSTRTPESVRKMFNKIRRRTETV